MNYMNEIRKEIFSSYKVGFILTLCGCLIYVPIFFNGCKSYVGVEFRKNLILLFVGILTVLIICYLIWYLKHFKSKKKFVKYYFQFFVFMSGSIILPCINLLLNMSLNRIVIANSLYTSLNGIFVLIFSFYFFVCTILLFLPFGPKILFLFVFVILSLGYFKMSWWAVFPLLGSLLLIINSEDIIIMMNKEEVDKDSIPYDLKRKWTIRKLLIGLSFLNYSYYPKL